MITYSVIHPYIYHLCYDSFIPQETTSPVIFPINFS